MINRINADLVYFTKVFNVETLKKINESEVNIQNQEKSFEQIQAQLENVCT